MAGWQNPGMFPVGYQPAQMQGWGQPMYPQYQQQIQQPQGMTYPTIHADIVQTDDDSVIERWAVAQDKAQMFINTGETRITVKSVAGNTVMLDVFEKRPPAPPAPSFDPAAYVTREELESRLAAMSGPSRAKKGEMAE